MQLPPWFSSTALGVIFFITLYIWFIVELLNTLVFGRSRRGNLRQDRGSYWVILLIIYGSGAVIFVLRGAGVGILTAPFQVLGLAFIWVGIGVREWAIQSLGRSYSVVVAVNPSQQLITSGLYRWVRHPSYSGSILTLAGIGLGVGTWLGAVLAIAIAIAGYSYRVHIEEEVMIEAFGQQYQDYMRHTGRFLPWF